MTDSFQLGFMLYRFTIGATALLLGRLIWTKRYRELPAFTGYLGISLARSVALQTLLAEHRMNEYSEVFWATRPIVLILLALVAAEMFGVKTREVLLFSAVGFACSLGNITLDRLFGFLIAACAITALFYFPKARPVARGLLVITLFPAIGQTFGVLLNSHGLRFIPTVSTAVAQVLWLASLARHQHVETGERSLCKHWRF